MSPKKQTILRRQRRRSKAQDRRWDDICAWYDETIDSHGHWGHQNPNDSYDCLQSHVTDKFHPMGPEHYGVRVASVTSDDAASHHPSEWSMDWADEGHKVVWQSGNNNDPNPNNTDKPDNTDTKNWSSPTIHDITGQICCKMNIQKLQEEKQSQANFNIRFAHVGDWQKQLVPPPPQITTPIKRTSNNMGTNVTPQSCKAGIPTVAIATAVGTCVTSNAQHVSKPTTFIKDTARLSACAQAVCNKGQVPTLTKAVSTFVPPSASKSYLKRMEELVRNKGEKSTLATPVTAVSSTIVRNKGEKSTLATPVTAVSNTIVPENNEVAVIHKIKINNVDYDRISNPKRMLNDNLIDMWMAQLASQVTHVTLANCQLWRQLSPVYDDTHVAKVAHSWFRDRKLFGQKAVFIPVNNSNRKHWYMLCVLNPAAAFSGYLGAETTGSKKKAAILYMDSLEEEDPQKDVYVQRIMLFLHYRFLFETGHRDPAQQGKVAGHTIAEQKWAHVIGEEKSNSIRLSVPMQTDKISCGLYALHCAQIMVRSRKILGQIDSHLESRAGSKINMPVLKFTNNDIKDKRRALINLIDSYMGDRKDKPVPNRKRSRSNRSSRSNSSSSSGATSTNTMISISSSSSRSSSSSSSHSNCSSNSGQSRSSNAGRGRNDNS